LLVIDWMVDMRLYLVITLLSSLLFVNSSLADSNSPPDADVKMGELVPFVSMGEIEDFKYTLPGFIWRSTQYMRFRLKKDEKQQHKSAVFYMLENVPNGKTVAWYSKERLANGKVRVVHSYPTGSGICRIYQAYIKVKGKSKHMTNMACKKNWSPSWSFSK